MRMDHEWSRRRNLKITALVCKTFVSRMKHEVCFLSLPHNVSLNWSKVFSIKGVCGMITQTERHPVFGTYLLNVAWWSYLMWWGKCGCSFLILFFFFFSFPYLPYSLVFPPSILLWPCNSKKEWRKIMTGEQIEHHDLDWLLLLLIVVFLLSLSVLGGKRKTWYVLRSLAEH